MILSRVGQVFSLEVTGSSLARQIFWTGQILRLWPFCCAPRPSLGRTFFSAPAPLPTLAPARRVSRQRAHSPVHRGDTSTELHTPLHTGWIQLPSVSVCEARVLHVFYTCFTRRSDSSRDW